MTKSPTTKPRPTKLPTTNPFTTKHLYDKKPYANSPTTKPPLRQKMFMTKRLLQQTPHPTTQNLFTWKTD